jgi:hypothetical protein
MNSEIFIQIPAYRDPQTLFTIQDALAKAKLPERITFGVCWQYMPGEDEHMLPRMALPPCVRLLSVPALESKGPCWARHKVQTLYAGERYVLSIDSHTRFLEDWDVSMIDEWQRCENPRAVLTTYPAKYTLPDDLDIHALPTYLVASDHNNNAGLPRFNALYRQDCTDRPLRGLFLAAGFHFASGVMIDEVPVDPYLYINQEEIVLATRLWTHGYDMYSPVKNIVFHLYINDANVPGTSRQLHQSDNVNWGGRDARAHARVQHILGGEPSNDPKVLRDVDKYGLGAIRTLDAFKQLAGIDFISPKNSLRAHQGEFIDELNPWLKQSV